MKRILKLVILFFIAVVFTFFIFSNVEVVNVRLLFWEIKIRLFLLIITVFLLGMFFANFINYFKNFYKMRNYKIKIKDYKLKIKRLENEK